MNHFRVIIIGAGPAGMAAAARLLEKNMKDITILEAENRIGGRVYTSEIGGNLVELGAEWIHGEKDNVVYEMASKFNLADTEAMSELLFQETNFYELVNKQVDKEISREMCNLYQRIIYSDQSEASRSEGSLGDYFMKEYKRGVDELKKKIKVTESLASKFADIFEKWENSIDASDSWYETSLPGNLEYWQCEGNVVTIWKGNGYRTLFDLLEVSRDGCSRIFDFLLKMTRLSTVERILRRSEFPISCLIPFLLHTPKISLHSQRNFPYGSKSLNVKDKVQLNKKVTKIVWNSKSVSGVPNVIVECQDGTTFTSDYVISTFSLGVLKEKAQDLFVPPLSDKKLCAIKGLGFGTVDKIFLKFPYSWWSEDLEGFGFLWSEQEKTTDESGWISEVIAFHPVRPESTVLRGWVIGEAARRMGGLTDNEVLDGCMTLLNKFMGFKYNIPRAELILRSTWYTNPHFRGSYSCRLVESDRMNVWASDLAQPEFNVKGKPVLLFAGEATHDHYFSTVHGAVETGRREADRLLENVLGPNSLKDNYEVIIVGAGISGLAAAKTLHEEGITDVLIIEAQDVPGGRIRSIQLGDAWLELGAQWIHGDKNELFDICRDNDLVTDKYSQEGQGFYLREDATVIDEEIVRDIDDFIKTVLEDCEEYVALKEGEETPGSIGEELLNKFNEYLDNSNDSDELKAIKKDLLYWHIRFHLIDNSCDDLNNISARAWGLFRFCGGNDYINFKKGYSSIVDVMISYIPECKILYSTPVSVIEWNENVNLERSHMNGDVNFTCNGDDHKNLDSKIFAKVICNNDFSFSANYVIVTSSLGYLKSNHEKMFHPPLPNYLTKAIKTLGYGVLGKIFLIYEKPWWDSGVKGFQLVWSHKRIFDSPKKHWAIDVTGFDVIIEDGPVLLGWVSGEGARTVESMPEDVLGEESTEILRQFTGRSDIPLPERVLKSKWFSNEFVQGGYSHITVEYDKNGIDGSNLSCPVYTNVVTEDGYFKKPTILLAGEAVHQTHFSTVHGAYESGVSQARVVVNDVRSQCR